MDSEGFKGSARLLLMPGPRNFLRRKTDVHMGALLFARSINHWRTTSGIPLALGVLLFATFIAAHRVQAQTNSSKPNIVMICVDDLNDWVGYLANDTEQGLLDILVADPEKRQRLKDFITPNVDRLAETGVAFTRAYSNCPLCGPSRASFLTGLHPSTTGYYDQSSHFRSSVPGAENFITLPQHLKQQGYLTVEAGKVFHRSRGGNPNDVAPKHSDPQSWSAQHVQWGGTHWNFVPNRIKDRHFPGNPWQYDPATTKEDVQRLGRSPAPVGSALSMSRRWHGGKITGEYFSKFFYWGVLPEPGNPNYHPSAWHTLATTFDYRQADYVASFLSNLSPEIADQKFKTDIDPQSGKVVPGLPNRKLGQPFFVAYGGRLPHDPFIVPESFAQSLTEIISPEDLEISALEQLNQALDNDPNLETRGQLGHCGRRLAKLAGLHDAIVQSGEENFGDRHHHWRNALFMYLASIKYSDACVGRIMDGLQLCPEKDNTIVIMLSDHGWHLGSKAHWSKMTLWEEANHIPFIIKAPGIKPAKCHHPVDLLSVYSTVLELTGLPAPRDVNSTAQQLDSVSIAPLLQDPQQRWSRPVMISYKDDEQMECFAAVDDRWKFIHYSYNGEEEFYDLKHDPFELTNILRQESSANAEAKRAYRHLRSTIKSETQHAAKKILPINPKSHVAFGPSITKSLAIQAQPQNKPLATNNSLLPKSLKPPSIQNNPGERNGLLSGLLSHSGGAALFSMMAMICMFLLVTSVANLEFGTTKTAADDTPAALT